MQLSQVPVKFTIPFAANAGGSFISTPIPESSQIGITPGAASLNDGFPPTNFQPVSSGGVPPRGVDFNGLLFQATSWIRWTTAGGPIFYDSTFQTACGGYPQYAVVRSLVSPFTFWESTVDSNTSNPDTGGANWIQPAWAKGTGDWAWRPVSLTLPGHIVMNGTTAGKAGSGATQASDTYLFVYQYLWNNFSNTQCPVSTGRGANATADFNAGKTIGTLNMQSTGIGGMDSMMGGTPNGQLGAIPIVSGGPTIAGSVLGTNLHVLITNELASHTHTFSGTTGTENSQHGHVVPAARESGAQSDVTPGSVIGALNQNVNSGTEDTQHTHAIGGTTAAQGGGVGHNNYNRNMIGVWFMHI